MVMRVKRVVAALAAVVLVLAAVVALVGHAREPQRERAEREHESFRPKEAVLEREQDGLRESERGSTWLTENRAYPRGYVQSRRALATRKAFRGQPTRLSASGFKPGARHVTARANLTSSWEELGPVTPNVPAAVSYT